MSAEERREERIRNYQNYRSIADRNGLSDYQVSQRVSLNPSVFSDWKSGKSQPKYDKLKKIADCLDETVDALLA